MKIARISIQPNEVRRFTVDYREFLRQGETIITPDVAVAGSSVASTVGTIELTPAETEVIFYLIAGPVNENFLLAVQIHTTQGQTLNDTIQVNCGNLSGPLPVIGPAGPTGARGVDGSQGQAGPTGPFGGPTGTTGPTGPTGYTGGSGVQHGSYRIHGRYRTNRGYRSYRSNRAYGGFWC